MYMHKICIPPPAPIYMHFPAVYPGFLVLLCLTNTTDLQKNIFFMGRGGIAEIVH